MRNPTIPHTLVLPPFSNQIDPEHSMVMIYCGRRAWQLAKPEGERVASLVFPRQRDPAHFKWPVEGRHVLVLGGDAADEDVDLLVIELLRAGADLVDVRYQGGRVEQYDPKAPRVSSAKSA